MFGEITDASSPKKLLVVLLRGLPGVGKTTLSMNLAEELNYSLIAKDDIRDVLYGIEEKANQMLEQAGSEERITTNAITYDVMFKQGLTQLRCGLNIILESPLGTTDRYNRFCDLADVCHAVPVLIDCTMNESKWRERLLSRKLKGTEPSHKPHDPDKILSYYQGQLRYAANRGPCLTLNMEEPVEDLTRKAVAWLSNL